MDMYNYLHKTRAVILFTGAVNLIEFFKFFGVFESRIAALLWITVVNVKLNIGLAWGYLGTWGGSLRIYQCL